MKRLVSSYTPSQSSVQIAKLDCAYKPHKESTTFAPGQKDGVHTIVHFEIGLESKTDNTEQKNDDENVIHDVVAVEFNFVLYDVFDRFLTSVQGLAGPGIYKARAKKNYRARWVFDLDGAFSQYHALCFPSQVRFSDGTIWRCDRDEVIDWLNETMSESGEIVDVLDVFPDGVTREGLVE